VQRSAAVFFVLAFGMPAFGCAGVLGLDPGEPLDFDAGGVPGVDGNVPLVDAAPDRAVPDAAPDGGCTPEEKTCGNSCVAIDDPDFGCGATTCNPCPSDNVQSRTCAAGACALTCKPGYADCDATAPGCETPLGTDKNCKGCGDACPVATPFCDTAANPPTCSATCNSPKRLCGASNCWDITNDPDHCGATCPGVTCASPNHADRTCGGGQCKYTCQAPWSACGGDPALGCPYNTTSDPTHCGPSCDSCGNLAPPNMHPAGCNGTCQFACNPGYTDCDGVPGCECTGTCSGSACLTGMDAGKEGGACVWNVPSCTSDGTSCVSDSQCCGCRCAFGLSQYMCCFQPGKFPTGNDPGLCCSGSCNPVASAEAGPGEAGTLCQCN
jgi:hypothetical protein